MADGRGGRREVGTQPRGLPLSRMLTVSNQTDEHGRLLLEDSAPGAAAKRAVRAGVPMRSVACPYEDTRSRQGGLMNVSAYEALRRDTREMLDGFAWVRRQYARVAGADAQASVQGLVDVSRLCVTLPLVLFHRAQKPVPAHGGLPSFVASMFKASRGVFSAAVAMLGPPEIPSATSPAEIVAYADAHGHLRRPQSGRVCAAPTRLIERTLGAILTGEGGDAERSRMGDLVAFPMLWDFYRLERAFARGLREYTAVLEQLLQGGRARDPQALFGQTVTLGGQTRPFGAFTDAFLDYANQAQSHLNAVLGRSDDAPPVTFQDVLQAL